MPDKRTTDQDNQSNQELTSSGQSELAPKNATSEVEGPQGSEVHYVIALKREYRDDAHRQLLKSVEKMSGVRVRTTPSGTRIHVFAPEEAVTPVKALLSPSCHIEKVMIRELD